MINTRISKKNHCLSGQITVMASITIVFVLSVIIECVNSARASRYTGMTKQAVMLSMEALFGSYHEAALKEYELFLLNKSETIEDKFKWYVQNNIDADSNNIDIVSAGLTDYIRVTDGGGRYFRAEIVEHMKYGIYADIMSELDILQEKNKKAKALSEAVVKITECDEEFNKLDKDMLELIELIEGIDTNEYGFVLRNGMPVATKQPYAKQLIHGEVSKETVNITNNCVYEAMNYDYNLYLNMDELIKDIADCCDNLKRIGDEESEKQGHMSYANIYKRDFEKLKNGVEGVRKYTNAALDVIDRYYTDRNEAKNKLKKTLDYIFERQEEIGVEVYDGMKADLLDMERATDSSQQKLCNIVTIKNALVANKSAIDTAWELLESMNVILKADICDEISNKNAKCCEALNAYSLERLRFDYSKVNFSASSTGLDSMKKMYEQLTDECAGIVLKGKTVSDKEISCDGLAVTYKSMYESSTDKYGKVIDTALFDEYLLTHFDMYTDYIDETNDANTEALLDYSIEYIIAGNRVDSENIKSVMLDIALIRQGINLSYLISDSGKRNQAYALAASLLGFTGSDAIIRIGQYVILAFWAMGESIVDLRELYDGNRVAFIKTKDTWKLSLTSLINMQFEDETAIISDKRDGAGSSDSKDDTEEDKSKGLNYKDYLRMLLLMEDASDKHYRTMTAIELKMIELGHDDFRMNNYLIGVTGKTDFSVKGLSGKVSQQIKYSYLEK